MVELVAFFIFGLAWLGFGTFMLARPGSALRNTQWPWTRLPKWGMRTLGMAVLGGAVWWFYLFATRLRR